MKINESDVDKILKKNKGAVQLSLIKNATEAAKNALNETATQKQRNTVADVTKSYVKQYAKGGSYCPDPDKLGDKVFVKWLDDRYDKAKEDIMNYLKDYDGSKNPTELAKGISDILNSDIDAKRIMRTETEKIRTAAKMTNMRANNVKYVRYVAVMDERVRDDHAALDGQIFPIDEAPVLGEPNCRCTYVPATQSEYDTQKQEYKEYDVKGDWTAEKAQKWLNMPKDDPNGGRAVGIAIKNERADTIEKQREAFLEAMKELDGEARLNALKKNSYKPEWLKAQTNVIAQIPYDVFKVLEETIKVFPKIDIKAEVVDKQNYLKKGFAELYKANVDNCAEFFKDFPEAADFKKLTIKTGKIGKRSVTRGLFEPSGEEVTLYANAMMQVADGTIELVGDTVGNSTSILLHETGHALDSKVKRMGSPKTISTTFFQMNPDVTLKDAPSEYGKTKYAEFCAECIADYYFNKSNAKPISKRFVAFAKEMMNEIRNR